MDVIKAVIDIEGRMGEVTKFQDSDDMVIYDKKSGTLFVFDPFTLTIIEYTGKNVKTAIGSGVDYAVGAMEKGATPEEAVTIACKFHASCQEPVNVFRYKKEVVSKS